MKAITDEEALKLLGGDVDAIIDQAQAEVVAAAASIEEQAHARGFQAGLRAAGEPWVALFFGLAGLAVGLVIGIHVG